MLAKSWWGKHRSTGARIALAVVGALVVQVGVADAVQALPLLPRTAAAAAPKAHLGDPVHVTPVPVGQLPQRHPAPNYRASATTWPAATATTVPLGAQAPKASQVSQVSKAAAPVWGTAVPSLNGVSAGPTSLNIRMLGHAQATAAGVSGVLAQVTPAGGTGSGKVRVGFDYSAYAQAFGGDYAQRLRLVELPACALTTPQLPACRVQQPLRSTNDTTAKSISATLTLAAPTAAATSTPTATTGSTAAASSAAASRPHAAPTAATTGGAMVMALTASASSGDGGSAGGQYGATSLKAAGSWTAGGSSGTFDYTYPITLPPAISPLAPTVGLSYDSGNIDGQTASTQAQSSWIGDGWNMADSFVEQSFVTCAQQPEGQTLPTADQTGDMCYDGPILTLSLNGSSMSLIQDSHGNWRTSNDNGDVITHVTSSGNGSGTYNTDYWTVTDRSGTVFSFGRNELPGWSSGKPTTNSVDYEPVYSSQSGDPCYNSAGFTSSMCTMAYRWHLDYVTDLHSNAMSYYYQQDTNYYAGDNGAKNGSSSYKYVRDSHLDHIDYGYAAGNAYGTVADKVSFATGDRCFAAAGSCDPLNSTTAPNWPDVPFDLVCAQGATCTSYGPAFFSTRRLTAITTSQWNGTAYNTVDSYALTESIPTTGTYNTSTLQLNSIARTGQDTTAGGTTPAALTESFGYQMLANRVNYTSGTGSGLGPLNRYRLNQITTDSGSVIGVSYELVNACTPTSITSITPSSNTASCFPVQWTPQGVSQPITDWFNKYVVQSVSQSDPSGKSAGLFTQYNYLGGGAWHYDDNEVTLAKYRTYGQWRGFGDVQTLTGQGTDPVTEAETWYYRGMDGDWLSSSSTRSISLKDSQGNSHTDANQIAGQALETAAYTSHGGSVDHSSINSYWISPATASRSRSGLPALTANAVGQVETWNRQAVTSGSTPTWRTTETDTGFDTNATSPTFGLPLISYSHGDLSLTSPSPQETCTETSYAPANTTLNLVGLVAETETDDKPCGGTSPAGSSAPTAAQTNALTAPTSLNKATDVVSDTRTFFDNPTMAGTWPQPSAPTWPQAAPTKGEASVEQDATGWNGTAFTYQTKKATTFDGYGRPTASWDGDGNKTSSAYTDTSYLTTTAIKATNALGQATTTTLDPERDLTLTDTDSNSITSTVHYDGLGRVVAVWKNSRSTGSPANLLYSYTFPAAGTTAPVVVTTQTLNEESGYATSTTLYDALLRVRQTQAPAVSTTAGRVVTDTFYDSHGWTYKTNKNYYDNTASPNGTLVTVADNLSHQQTLTSFDGLGRPTVVTSLDDSAVKATGYTQYLGDRTITVPPTGAAAGVAVVDALGRTTESDQYSVAPTVTTSVTGGFTTASVTGGTTQATKHTFDAKGRAYQTVDPNGDTWTTGYNFLGQPVTKTDPDAGTSAAATVYDPAGNTLQSTDSAGHTLSYVYDAANRKIAEYDAPVSGQTSANEVASWVYDNSNNISGVTNPVGHATTVTSYTPAGNFVVQAKGFNAFNESLGETYTVPGTGGLSGSYAYQHSYTPTIGLPKATLVPAAGGMAQEVLSTGYCTYSGQDQPCTLGGTNGYTQNVSYTVLGQVAQQVIGSATNQATVSSSFDTNTGALTDQNVVNTAVSSTPMDDTSYGYDPSGNITSQTDTRNGSSTETQCYGYDPLDRLNLAWTTNKTASSCGTQPTTSNVTSTVADGIGGSAYWTSWSFDLIGQPKQQVQHDLTGTGADTVTSYNYGGSDTSCTTASSGAHTLAFATTTGTSSSTSTYCYDGLGNTTSRTTSAGQQNLTWNDEGKLSQATTGPNTTGYYYSADGNLVERTDPGSTTLFLPDQQITYFSGTSSLNAVRSYALPGGGDAVLNNLNYSFVLSDSHGTATISLDSNAKNPTWRQSTPYGAPRGTAPGANWLDPNGFLGKPQDTNDQLTTIGAREYDTTLGRFISLDPVLETDPQQANGYTYAGANPVTGSDPTGLFCDGCGPSYYSGPGCSFNADGSSNGNCDGQGTASPTCDQSASCRATLQQQIAAAAARDAAIRAALAAEAKARAEAEAKAKAEQAAAHRHCSWYDVVCQVEVHAAQIEEAALIVVAAAVVIAAVAVAAPLLAASSPILFAALSAGTEAALGGATLGMSATAAVAAGVSAAAEGAGMATIAAGAATLSVAAGSGYEAGGGESCSFAPDTPVLMADGTTEAIGRIKVGDRVEAADPETGKDTGGRTVQHIWIKHDNDLLDLTVRTASGHLAVIHTTVNHPFWDATTHTWIRADHLKPGHKLGGTHGQTPTVVSTKTTPGAADRWNLTVQQLHTYYVLAGGTAVLVHNCATATVQELHMATPAHGTQESLLKPLQGLSDDELLNAVNNPNDGEHITLNQNNTVVQGNHRVAELARRADDPKSKIQWDTRVTIERYRSDNSMFYDMEGGGGKSMDDLWNSLDW